MTQDQAEYLISLPKFFIDRGELLDFLELVPQRPFIARYFLLCQEEGDYSFFIDVKQSAKAGLKFSLHFQEGSSDYGLLRVDFNGRHKNPEVLNDNVPPSFRPYTGIWLDYFPGHIHYVIDGYKPLAWVVPLEIDTFPVKEILTFPDITAAFAEFCKVVSVKTELRIITQSDLGL